MNNELKQIKKEYGERMARFCRDSFPSILEDEGLLIELLNKHFNQNKDLYSDLVSQYKKDSFKSYILSLTDIKIIDILEVDKTPKELLNEAGYDLYECHCKEDIAAFEKYYKSDELLCTFKNDRLKTNFVFFAVKHNVNDVKRENFEKPERDDLYGTSVISIQFSRNLPNTLSIKNRYNHKVANPDSTFGNNLELINKGLTESFQREYKLDIVSNDSGFELAGYVLASDSKYYKYNMEIDNVNYCPDNIIIDNHRVKKYDTSRYLVVENYIFDMKEKKVILYEKDGVKKKSEIQDDFVHSLFGIEKFEIKKTDDGKEIKFSFKDKEKVPVVINVNKNNQMIKLKNHNLTTIGDKFLANNRLLTSLDLPSLVSVGNDFLKNNLELEELNIPKLEVVQNNFLRFNRGLEEINASSLIKVGSDFLQGNKFFNSFYAPKLAVVGECFLYENEGLTSISLPSLSVTGDNFIFFNKNIEQILIPNVRVLGSNFLNRNQKIKNLNVPNLVDAGSYFLYTNTILKNLYAPRLITTGYGFLYCNAALTEIELTSLVTAGSHFLYFNKKIERFKAKNLLEVGKCFMLHNESLFDFDCPEIHTADSYLLEYNKAMRDIVLRTISHNKEISRQYVKTLKPCTSAMNY